MNSLSWLLYFAGVVGGLQTVLILFSVLLSLLFVISIGLFFVTMDDLCYEKEHETIKKYGPRFGWSILVAVILACLIPSKDTLYMIAASEMGEEIIQSETGKKAQAALNRYLDQIGQEKH